VHQGLIKNEHTITWPLFPQSLNPLETCPCRDACIVWRRLRPNYGSSHHNCQKQTDTFQFHELLQISSFPLPLIQRLPVAFYSDGQNDESEERDLPKLKRDIDDAIPF
jgi:hypothetical protein